MTRALILVFDSFGIGASQDADKYGDVGANTLGHIAEQTPLHLPNLVKLGLARAAEQSCGHPIPGLDYTVEPEGFYGYAVEKSFGKDTPSGHWEMAGLPVLFDWGYFHDKTNSFPLSLLDDFISQTNVPGVLGNCHASGTRIIERFGEEHCDSGKPIVYTSADSVFQIAAHEETFGLERLYEVCEIARQLVDPYQIGRVIARPFTGSSGQYTRTHNRRDYATPPFDKTLLDVCVEAGREVISVGKIADIFAHRGITQKHKANGNMALFDKTLKVLHSAPEGCLIFTNFVDFDMLYGHRRDVIGYARALEALDARLPELFDAMESDDFAIITADHGCDPTFPGSDHTREHVPVLGFGPKVKARSIGRCETFADIGKMVAQHLGVTLCQ